MTGAQIAIVVVGSIVGTVLSLMAVVGLTYHWKKSQRGLITTGLLPKGAFSSQKPSKESPLRTLQSMPSIISPDVAFTANLSYEPSPVHLSYIQTPLDTPLASSRESASLPPSAHIASASPSLFRQLLDPRISKIKSFYSEQSGQSSRNSTMSTASQESLSQYV
ncbi:hypothetical protein HDU91_000497 [Kappamyces sp. JEL0680]|nr:hypothetical protein HDU91_000497 [Kappamyces sp. JEL0680]